MVERVTNSFPTSPSSRDAPSRIHRTNFDNRFQPEDEKEEEGEEEAEAPAPTPVRRGENEDEEDENDSSAIGLLLPGRRLVVE